MKLELNSSNVWEFYIPRKFVNKKFGELYDYFCDNNLIILGLYRLSGGRDNNTGYMFTKPNTEVKITFRDKVFVLATKEDLKKINRNILKKNGDLNINMKIMNKGGNKINNIININNNNEEEKNDENDSDDYFDKKNKNSPFNYIKEQLFEINKEINKLQDFIDVLKVELKDNISSGIKEEINSLLEQYE